MPCYEPPRPSDREVSERQQLNLKLERLESHLCYACKKMSKEEMLNSPPVDDANLYEWYVSHLQKDLNRARFNGHEDEKMTVINEAKRIGLTLVNMGNVVYFHADSE